ncbi:MAG: hypothetical protein ABI723_15610 [Bacteroidia bacterium]
MEKQFSRNRKNLIVSYNNVENKIILGFVNEVGSESKAYDYYVLDIKETATFIDLINAIKELFETVPFDAESSYEENYVRPKRIKLPASEEELYYDYLKELAHVVIALPQNKTDHEIQDMVFTASKDFMETLGYEIVFGDDDADLSEFQQYNFKRTNKASEEDIKELYAEAKKALETRISKPSTKSILKIAEAAGKLISSLDLIPEAAIRLGVLLIVKAVKDEKTVITVKAITPSITAVLDEHPRLLKHPKAALELITVPVKQKQVKSWRKP